MRTDSLDVKYKGPFGVVARRGTNFEIKRARGTKWVHANRCRYYIGSGGGESISDRTPITAITVNMRPATRMERPKLVSNHESEIIETSNIAPEGSAK